MDSSMQSGCWGGGGFWPRASLSGGHPYRGGRDRERLASLLFLHASAAADATAVVDRTAQVRLEQVRGYVGGCGDREERKVQGSPHAAALVVPSGGRGEERQPPTPQQQ